MSSDDTYEYVFELAGKAVMGPAPKPAYQVIAGDPVEIGEYAQPMRLGSEVLVNGTALVLVEDEQGVPVLVPRAGLPSAEIKAWEAVGALRSPTDPNVVTGVRSWRIWHAKALSLVAEKGAPRIPSEHDTPPPTD